MFKKHIFLTCLCVIAVAIAIASPLLFWDSVSPPKTTVSSESRSQSANKITDGYNSSLLAAKSISSKETLSQTKKTTTLGFDVVRITQDGNAVIAGWAAPNSKVVIIDNGQFLAQLNSDTHGKWVFVPEKPFPPGSRQLGLKMLIDGQKTITSDDVLVLVVPEPKKDVSERKTNKPSQPIAIKFSKKDGASSVLQKPTSNVDTGPFGLDTVDYEETGQLIISGHATPETSVIVYLNNLAIGKSAVDENGIWTIRPAKLVKPGLYTLRADQITPSGEVLSRVSMPFSRADPIERTPSEPFVIVQPGNSLWRIARKNFGNGFRFTTIYEANKEQIQDPNLIFPGQVFVMPSNND